MWNYEKYWILIATCLNTRAIALEPLCNMTTATLYEAFERISARRTTPQFVVSDNADQHILLKQHIETTRDQPFDWKFITPSASHEGGVYERPIALVKRTLQRTFRGSIVRDHDQFHTLLYKIEAILNDRPITYIGEEPGIRPLTPNHFLKTQLPSMRDQPIPISNPSEVARSL